MSSDKYFVFYVMFDETKIPVFCQSVEDDPYLEGYFKYEGVEGLNDNVFPDFLVDGISLPKKDVLYYVSGTKKEMKEEIENKEKTEASPKEESVSGEMKEEKPLKRRRRRRFSDNRLKNE